jgi:hypothetical protein
VDTNVDFYQKVNHAYGGGGVWQNWLYFG